MSVAIVVWIAARGGNQLTTVSRTAEVAVGKFATWTIDSLEC
jgi:hypothetical protein